MIEGIDQVAIEKASGFNLVSVTEWVELPLSQKVQLILDHKVRFLNGDEQVPIKEALARLSASGH